MRRDSITFSTCNPVKTIACVALESRYKMRSHLVIGIDTSVPNVDFISSLKNNETNYGGIARSIRCIYRYFVGYIFKSSKPSSLENLCSTSQLYQTGSLSFVIDCLHASNSTSIGWLLYRILEPSTTFPTRSNVNNWPNSLFGVGYDIRETCSDGNKNKTKKKIQNVK